MTFIVAEAGVNHNGDYTTAVKLCDAAKAAHSDAVKFQFFDSMKLWGDERIKHLELCAAEFINLAWHCKDIGIEFMATPFDAQGVRFITSLGVKRMKVASGCINRWELLDAIAEKMPVILSTGMSSWEDIQDAADRLRENPLTLLHCTSIYPCPLEEVNLRAIWSLRKFGCSVGYSDHTEGVVCAIAAAALSADVIEKHLTLDRGQDGPDHKSSIEPTLFGMMVQSIRSIEQALGDGIKRVMPGELELRKAWGRD